MFELDFGDTTIRSIEEVSGFRYTPAFLFPGSTPELIAQHVPWMAPDLYDVASDRLAMVRQSNLIRTPHHTILIDTCVGDCKTRNVPTMHNLNSPWRDNFHAHGVGFEDVDFVMCTHLHVDHVGWHTRLENGRWVPTFPNAKYVFARTELEFWQQSVAAGQDSPDGPVFADSVAPVLDAGLALVVDDAAELFDGLWLEPTPGHSVGHVAIHLERDRRHVVFSGDLMHHPIQVREVDLVSRFCESAAGARQARRQFLERYADRDVLVVPAHFERGTAGHIKSAADGFHFDFLAGGSTRTQQG